MEVLPFLSWSEFPSVDTFFFPYSRSLYTQFCILLLSLSCSTPSCLLSLVQTQLSQLGTFLPRLLRSIPLRVRLFRGMTASPFVHIAPEPPSQHWTPLSLDSMLVCSHSTSKSILPSIVNLACLLQDIFLCSKRHLLHTSTFPPPHLSRQ